MNVEYLYIRLKLRDLQGILLSRNNQSEPVGMKEWDNSMGFGRGDGRYRMLRYILLKTYKHYSFRPLVFIHSWFIILEFFNLWFFLQCCIYFFFFFPSSFSPPPLSLLSPFILLSFSCSFSFFFLSSIQVSIEKPHSLGDLCLFKLELELPHTQKK